MTEPATTAEAPKKHHPHGPQVSEPADDEAGAEYQPPDGVQLELAAGPVYEPALRPSAGVTTPTPAVKPPQEPAPIRTAAAVAADQGASEPAGHSLHVLPLGAGLALVGLGLGFLGLRLRRS
ncbi:hypothetical protein QMK19_00835 [Streptomyces sp. H10-C2]|nr:hypothetical protein [Streptomyces sp. H10-C2]MDJ0340285.1 hypothetical protein [Streptomyces sp. PH10-H1]MDJ0368267.1 hypothetical protein [Streptomyces sp. H10-C2]